ncbi:MAG: hypothetical protein U5L96_11280 [Owenweeksia sp.]|nr:hypothetical protein [Owenweeksia sp.]
MCALNYNVTKSYRGLRPRVNQSLSGSGDFELTKNWRIGFNTGFDLEARDFSYTTIDFYRNLHCWELTASWVPFELSGRDYFITIRVKSSMLSDLKLERKRGYGDFER